MKFIKVTANSANEAYIYINVNFIREFSKNYNQAPNQAVKTIIYTADDKCTYVEESPEEILELIKNA